MKDIIPKDTRYVPLTQQKSCCVPASISIIMLKLGIKLVPQELLGYHLGLKVNKEDKHLFWNVKTGKKYKYGYGTSPNRKKYGTNMAFRKLKIPLRAKFVLVKNFKTNKDFISYIEDKVKNDKDIIACFNPHTLVDSDKPGGHFSVVDRIYKKKNIIRLIDPSFNQPKWKEVDIDKLKKAMELHPVRGGFWELEKIK